MADISGKYGALSKDGIWKSCDQHHYHKVSMALSLFIHFVCYTMTFYFVKSLVIAYLHTCLHYCIIAQYFSVFNCLFLIIFHWNDLLAGCGVLLWIWWISAWIC